MNHIYLHSLQGEKISLLNPNCCKGETILGYMLFPSVMGDHFICYLENRSYWSFIVDLLLHMCMVVLIP